MGRTRARPLAADVTARRGPAVTLRRLELLGDEEGVTDERDKGDREEMIPAAMSCDQSVGHLAQRNLERADASAQRAAPPPASQEEPPDSPLPPGRPVQPPDTGKLTTP